MLFQINLFWFKIDWDDICLTLQMSVFILSADNTAATHTDHNSVTYTYCHEIQSLLPKNFSHTEHPKFDYS